MISTRMPKFRLIAPLGASRQMGEILLCHFFVFCNHNFCWHPESKLQKRFWCCLIHTSSISGYCIPRGIKLHKVCVFLHFHPKMAWLGIFTPISHNIDILISWKLHFQFQPNFAQRQRPHPCSWSIGICLLWLSWLSLTRLLGLSIINPANSNEIVPCLFT